MLRINIDQLSKSYGDRLILDGIHLQVSDGERVGLVGKNGGGKSTLMKILVGQENWDGGSFQIHGRTGYLAQKADDDKGKVKEYFKKSGARDYEVRRVMERVGLPDHILSASMASLSGGERTKVRICGMLLIEPEILMLDEPTNHLDIDSLQWLESFITRFTGTIFVISHDRYFLDKGVNRIIELDGGHVKEYSGNYSHYVARKKQEMEKEQQEYEAYVETKAQLEEAIRKRMQKAQRMVKKGRNCKSSEDREGKDYYGAKSKKMAHNAKALENRLERLEKKEKPRKQRNINIQLRAESQVTSKNLIEGRDLEKGFGERILFSKVSFRLQKGDRIALLGNNGEGKTTLLRMILGNIGWDQGEIQKAPGVKMGYLDQELNQLQEDAAILDEIYRRTGRPLDEIRTLLGSLLFRGDDVYKPIGVLSMGEKVRVTLARLILSDYNVLIMDEPTNHLDLPSRQAVEDALLYYSGTLLFVSHDRYFLDRMATGIWHLAEKRLDCYPFPYSEYVTRQEKGAESKAQEDLLVLENRLSQLSAALDQCSDEVEKSRLNQAFLDTARHIRRIKEEKVLENNS